MKNDLFLDYFQSLKIDPKDYMSLIYEMTLEKVRYTDDDQKVRAFSNLNNIRTEQILTEQGICYVANNFLALNLSTKYEQLGYEYGLYVKML